MVGLDHARDDALINELAKADERVLWTYFFSTENFYDVVQSWLVIVSRTLDSTLQSVVANLDVSDGRYSIIAQWPDTSQVDTRLHTALQSAVAQQVPLVFQHSVNEASGEIFADQITIIALPILHGEQSIAALAFAFPERPPAEVSAIIRKLSWDSCWVRLSWLQHQQKKQKPVASDKRDLPRELIAIWSAPFEQNDFDASIHAFLTELANALNCDLAGLGFLKNGAIQLAGISHRSDLVSRSTVVNQLESAMNETYDLRGPILWSTSHSDSTAQCYLHQQLARDQGASCILSIPFSERDRIAGVVTLLRTHKPQWLEEEIALAQTAIELTGAMLELMHRQASPITQKIVQASSDQLHRWLSPTHLTLKIGVVLSGLLLAWLCLTKTMFHVSDRAILEPYLRAAASAPFQGYISQAFVRPGDLVQQDQDLAVLDDRELKLERHQSLAQNEKVQKQMNKSFAEKSAADTGILRAQLDQSAAQYELATERLLKTHIKAPIAGIVVSGDLTQKIGTPVEKGDVLYEIAPTEGFRVVIEVDERNIDEIHPDQIGQVVFEATPDQTLAFTIDRITPVSESKDGRNYFRVEAHLSALPKVVQPGMEGIAHIDIEDRSRWWIWTHQVFDWLHLMVWRWFG